MLGWKDDGAILTTWNKSSVVACLRPTVHTHTHPHTRRMMKVFGSSKFSHFIFKVEFHSFFLRTSMLHYHSCCVCMAHFLKNVRQNFPMKNNIYQLCRLIIKKHNSAATKLYPPNLDIVGTVYVRCMKETQEINIELRVSFFVWQF